MSKMGQFVMEAQEVACEHYNVISKAELQKFLDKNYPNQSYFHSTVWQEWNIIQEELHASHP